MDMPNGPGMIQPSPTSGNVLASLKRNVLWGVLGLVALIFTTVCVMSISSRQTEAANLDEAPVGTPAFDQTAVTDTVNGATTTLPNKPAPQTAANLTATEVLPSQPKPEASPAARSGAVAPVKPDTKPVVIAAAPAAKPAAKPEVKPAATSAAPKTLDAENLPHGTKLYTVKAGDTLEKIARDVYGDGHKWKRLAEINKDYVQDINRLKVGQKILVERTLNPRDYADY